MIQSIQYLKATIHHRNTWRINLAFYGYKTYFIAHLLYYLTVPDPGGE